MTKIKKPRFAALLGVLIASTLIAACTTPPSSSTPNSAGLYTTLAADGIQVTWNPTGQGQTNGYDLQYRVDGAGWTAIPTTFDNTVLFDDVTEYTQYWFRVRAKVAPGATANTFSDSVTAWYVVPKLPIVRIDTQNRAPILDRENYVQASMTIDPNGTAFAAYSGTLGIRGRGNSTWTLPKKPYKLKLDSKSGLMGMPSSKDYALLANYFDPSQVRTATAEAISKATDLAWTPSYEHVEVILNGVYQGVYQLAETVKVASNRVDIEEMEDTDNAEPEITGGYLLEIDARLEENNEPGWRTTRNVPVVVKDPEPYTTAQRNYIRTHVQTFEDVLYSSTFTDPVNGYRKYLDVESFIDHYLVQEITRNGDSSWSSTYFYKQRGDDKLYFGPMWDFDRSMGSPVTPKPQPPEGWYARGNGAWTRRLFQDPAFAAQVDARFRELEPTLVQMPDQVNALATSLLPALDNDVARWKYTHRVEDEPQFLDDWLTTRLAWMAANTAPAGS